MKNICLLDLNYTLVGNQADTRLLRPPYGRGGVPH